MPNSPEDMRKDEYDGWMIDVEVQCLGQRQYVYAHGTGSLVTDGSSGPDGSDVC